MGQGVGVLKGVGTGTPLRTETQICLDVAPVLADTV